MKICFLTQTAHDISDYYKEFFNKYDLFFITFKTANPLAVDFVPKSTWSAGRNVLWEYVRGKYDYYVFIDDDLIFKVFNKKVSAFPFLAYLYYKVYKTSFVESYELANPLYFFNRLKHYLLKYKPEVMAVTQLDGNPVNSLDTAIMRKNSFVRRVGFFDAQFTVFSDYAANKILPYDTKISGWSSAQIAVYLYSFEVFASKAINVAELGVANSHHVGAYTDTYNGMLDCATMITEISKATQKDYDSLSSGEDGSAVDYLFGKDVIINNIPDASKKEDYKQNFKRITGIENLINANMKI